VTDTSTPALPSFATSVLTALARHGLTTLAGFLLANGLLTSNQSDQFTSIGVSIVLGAAGLAWSWWQKKHAQTTLVAAINAPAAKPPIPVTAQGDPK
jgi:membrane protein DedA with SNARE-associated domain